MSTIAIILGAISLFVFIFSTCAFISSAVIKELNQTVVTGQVTMMGISAVGFYLTLVI